MECGGSLELYQVFIISLWRQNLCVCLESLPRSLFVQILVVKEFACLDG
jgi:hypothetical protein